MEVNKAIMAFSQSEKVKAGLIWISQALEILRGMPDGERAGGQRIVQALLSMVGHEVGLAKTIVGHEVWHEIESYIDKATIMVNSGVGEEGIVHISKALSKATTIGQQSMTRLQKEELL